MCFYKLFYLINNIYSKLYNLEKYSGKAEYYM